VNRRRAIGLLGFLVLSAGLLWTQTTTTLVILHTNDMHGQVLPRAGVGGLAEVATVIRREHPDLLLDGGDMFTGTMISDEFFGKPVIEILNHLHYNAVALGNHEFDYGLDELQRRSKEAAFPILSSNVDTGITEIKPYTILAVRGVRIGVIGLTVEKLAEVTHPKNLKTVTVRKLVDALTETLPKVRPLTDFVVLVTHIETEDQIRVAKAFPEIRLIIAGHPHIARTTTVGSTLIVETGNSTRFVGKVEMRLDGKTPDAMTSEMIPVRDIEPDPEVKAIIEPYHKAIIERAAQRLAESQADMLKSELQESPLNNLIADAMRDFAKTQIGVQNVGGLRAPLRKGVVTYGDIFEVLPFQNTLVKMSLTGAQLKRVLGRRVQAVSGLKISWDTRESSNQLVSVTLSDGTPIHDGDKYTVAVNDFMAVGGDGLIEYMDGAGTQDMGILLRDAVTSYIRRQGTLAGKTDGRVTIRTR
jgi:2',3'-cyclic-nucleotide 2'-phosphodiesterase (5'-nucleotidase family)